MDSVLINFETDLKKFISPEPISHMNHSIFRKNLAPISVKGEGMPIPKEPTRKAFTKNPMNIPLQATDALGVRYTHLIRDTHIFS
uniref:Uncharacterized protein n=1 Tax=Tanacetum cinerariifolium TaxID=118510 RepID=A0A699IEE1_TANCI|nr:hypothetical protein [Tanacetum cinerariifolium]